MWESLRKGVQSCINRVHRNNLRIKFFETKYFSKIILRHWAGSFGLVVKIFWRGFQNCILSVQMTTLRKNKFLEETFFISFSDIQRKYFAFVKNFSGGLSKLHSTCPAEHFEEKFVRKKNYRFRTLSRKNFGLLAKVSRQGGENWRSTGTLRHFLKKVIFSLFWGHWAKKSSAGLSILHSRHPWHLEKSFLLNKVNFLIFFRTLSENLGFWHTFFGRVVKTALYVSVGKIWKTKNLVLKNIIYIIFGY